ncbi:hypothetical protein BD779DRAFT_781050 [Infundibulicybe gibba]|nr:hypothetical protein BD779DRAFT_781050 [Infundibulicybe gibba]
MLADVSHVSVAQISQHGPSFPTFPSSSSADANTLPDRNKHPLACRACHDYLSHLGEAGHFPRDPPTWAQLQLAMREAKRERDIMDAFFDGRREGHRLEKENSAIRMSQVEEERDRTLALLKKCQADLLHAEQELFETILGVRAALAESGEPYLSSISREIGVRIQQVEVERDAALGLLEESKGELRRTQEKLFRALQELRFPSEPTTDVCQAVTKETVLHQTQEKVFRALQELKSHPSQVVSKEVLLQQTQDKLFQALQELRPPPKSDPDPCQSTSGNVFYDQLLTAPNHGNR